MKSALLLAQALTAAAAVIHPPSDFPHSITVVRDVNNLGEFDYFLHYKLHAHRIYPDKRQFPNLDSAAYISTLSTFIQWSTNRTHQAMNWLSLPTKTVKLSPSIDPQAKKVIIRYGPYTLKGANVRNSLDMRLWCAERMIGNWAGRPLPDGSKGNHVY
jgi:hypothetical protein